MHNDGAFETQNIGVFRSGRRNQFFNYFSFLSTPIDTALFLYRSWLHFAQSITRELSMAYSTWNNEILHLWADSIVLTIVQLISKSQSDSGAISIACITDSILSIQNHFIQEIYNGIEMEWPFRTHF